MGSDFDVQPFASLLSNVVDNRGRTCPTAASGIPLIATNCVRNDSLYPSYDTARFVDDKTFRTWFRGHPEPGDFLFVTKGSPGRVCLAPDPVDFCIAQDMVAVRADPRRVYPRFLFALLRSEPVQRQIEQLHVGTMIPHFKKGDFDKLLLPLPPRPVQEYVGDAYWTLSQRIDLNRRMSQTLESMARALFKSWFVDFDPVRAKSQGRDPGLPSDIADMFPDSFDDSGEPPIPAGWRVADLGDLIELHYGRALKDADRNPGPIPVFGSNGQVGWHSEPLARGPGVVLGRKGNPGTVTWAPTDFFAIDTTFYVVSPVFGLSPYFLYHALREQDLARLSADSAVPGLSRNLAYMNRQLLPSPGVLEAFDNACAPLAARSLAGQREVGFLTTAQSALVAGLLAASEPTPSQPRTRIGG